MKSSFSLHDLVMVIDNDETPDEWGRFTISFINGKRFLLTTSDKKMTLKPFWVNASQIQSLTSCSD